MRQFDVYENPVAAARRSSPCLVVLSSHLLPNLTEAVVAPLTTLRQRTLSGLEVAVILNDQPFVLLSSDLASIASQRLRRRLGNLSDYENEIRRALDRLFTGF